MQIFIVKIVFFMYLFQLFVMMIELVTKHAQEEV